MQNQFLWVIILACIRLPTESARKSIQLEDHAAPFDVGKKSLIQVSKSVPPAVGKIGNTTQGKNQELVERASSFVEDASASPHESCKNLKGLSYTSGAVAPLDAAGYLATAKLCCHYEMTQFVRREIARQDFEICDLADLHGFVHWFDCDNDLKTYTDLVNEIAESSRGNCPWLGLATCPPKGPNCRDFTACAKQFPSGSQSGASAPLNEAGFLAVQKTCCHTEMEQYILRVVESQGLEISNEGGLQGFLHYYDCTDDGKGQSFGQLKWEIDEAAGKHPDDQSCYWLKALGEKAPPLGHNCPWIETWAQAHRRRFCNQPTGAPLPSL